MKYRIRLHLEDRDCGGWDETQEFEAGNDEAAEQYALDEAESWFESEPREYAAVSASIELTDISGTQHEQAVSTILCSGDDACPTIYQHRSFDGATDNEAVQS